jgi:adenylyl-sulfate kinase
MVGATIWITGLSGSGKTTLANEVHRRLTDRGRRSYVLDGDVLRTGLNGDLGFSHADRTENVRRTGEVARMFNDAGIVAIVPLISPYRADRNRVRALHFLSAPLAVCEERDPKGLYAKVRAGELAHFTGVDDPYEPPLSPDLSIRPGNSVSEDAASVVALVRSVR